MSRVESVLVVQHVDGFGEVFVALLDGGFALLELYIFGGQFLGLVPAEEVEGESATFGGGSGLCHRWSAPAVLSDLDSESEMVWRKRWRPK